MKWPNRFGMAKYNVLFDCFAVVKVWLFGYSNNWPKNLSEEEIQIASPI